MLGGVTERAHLPKRTESPDEFLRQTRIGAAFALALLGGAVTSDLLDGAFWAGHAMITGLVASLLIIAISAAVLNELVERRARRRWSVLAQYVLLDLVRTARVTWAALLELAVDETDAPGDVDRLARGRALVGDVEALRESITQLLAEPRRRGILQRAIATAATHSDEVLGRWAGVMLSATAYTEVIDRHVELYSRVAWVDGLLGYHEPLDDDPRRRWLSAASPAVEVQQTFDDEVLCSMVVSIIVLAESLDRTTLTLAMRLVPLDWWTMRMRDGTTAASAS